MSSAWGSFSYDEKEDVVRFTATPRPADFEERLEYRFENPTDNSGRRRPPLGEARGALPDHGRHEGRRRGEPQERAPRSAAFFWQGWNQAAQWCVQQRLPISTRRSPGPTSRSRCSDDLREPAHQGGDPREEGGHQGGRGAARPGDEDRDRGRHQHLRLPAPGQKKTDEAIALFRKNVKDHPDSWNTYDSLGEALAAKGDKKGAIENYSKALAMVGDDANKKRINGILTKLKA